MLIKNQGAPLRAQGAYLPDNEIKRLRTTIAKKFPDAFIVAFAGGKRVNLSDAIRQSRSKR